MRKKPKNKLKLPELDYIFSDKNAQRLNAAFDIIFEETLKTFGNLTTKNN